MTPLLQLLEDALSQPLAVARQAASRMPVVGAAGADIPFELIAASGAFPVALPLFAEVPTPLADRYLESSFSPAARSIAQQWLTGAFDFLDAVVFPRSNDSLQRLYYYLCELRRRGQAQGPRPLLYDTAKIHRATSLKHSESTSQRLAKELNCEERQLPAAIGARNRRRALLRRLLDQRRSVLSAPGGQLAERIARAADFCEAASFDAALEHWLTLPAHEWRGARVLLAGSAPPDDRLHFAVEAAGGRIVDEYGDHSIDRLGEDIVAGEHPLSAIAHHYAQTQFGPRSFENRAAMILERASRSRIDAVILWLIEEDESLVWHVPAIKHALGTRGIPLLSLTRRQWSAKDGVLEEIQAFTRQLVVT
jgi:benzoyl-CoA reductase/2-hydroxyglutaryl-CoA dehydratase subunit BcrC/BadD/HgdB